MTERRTMRLNKVLRELNISLDRAVEYLAKNGHQIEARPTTKISGEVYQVLLDGFETDANKKAASKEVGEEKRKEKEAIRLELETKLERKRVEEKKEAEVLKAKVEKLELKTVGKIDIDPKPIKKEEPAKKAELVLEKPVQEQPKKELQDKPKLEESKPKEATQLQTKPVVEENSQPQVQVEGGSETIKTQYKKLDGPKLTGKKIDLKQFERVKNKPEEKSGQNKESNNSDSRKKRKRISKPSVGNPNQQNRNQGQNRGVNNNRVANNRRGQRRPVAQKEELSEAEVQKKVRETLEKLTKSKSGGSRRRRDRRDEQRRRNEEYKKVAAAENKVLKVTEFVTVSEVATMISVPVTDIISACMSLGMMVTMNQRLNAETLIIVADEFNYTVEFVGAEVEEAVTESEDNPEDLRHRAPIITVMGHVDHGKTSLLDYIREANVIAGESGGITQHIGAYSVKVEGGERIAFLDTPGHEAFTAMRARGAQVTDLVIIVIAADDDVMPQTKEAISHAQAANVPIIFAINKIDKPNANPDKIKEQLAGMNLLVEDWGGNIQSQDISTKTGQGVDELLEKVLLEAEVLELKANPDKNAYGTVVEALLDKGRGYVSTILVQSGTLRIGDYLLAGKHSGKVRAMFDERGKNLKEGGPSTPVSILGLDGAPQAGDKFNVFDDEREAKQIAIKRSQLQREQSVRTQKTLTLDEIGRRIALGDFKELNIILKGDVDGSVEALTDSFQKLSTEEIQVNILYKGVGAITESDVLLASASDAIIIGFNVRPQGNARTVAEKEEVDIRNYSIIYDAINDLKDAMEGMLSPEMKEEVTGNVEVREVYKISKLGNIAGCMVMSGKVFRDSKVRIIREGIVVHDGLLASLKRFKDDIKEVSKGYDCGVQIKNYNDIQIGDSLEAYQEVAVKKKLK